MNDMEVSENRMITTVHVNVNDPLLSLSIEKYALKLSTFHLRSILYNQPLVNKNFVPLMYTFWLNNLMASL